MASFLKKKKKRIKAGAADIRYYCLVIPIRRSAATAAQPFPIASHNLAVKHTVACDLIGKGGMAPARVCVQTEGRAMTVIRFLQIPGDVHFFSAAT